MISSRTRESLPPLLVLLAVAATVLMLYSRLAHASVGAPDPVPAPPFDWSFWSGIVLALATAGSYVLHALAALRHSATLEAIASDIDTVRLMAKGAPETPLKLVKPPAVTGTAAMLIVLLLGVAGAGLAAGPGCGGSQSSRVATIGSVDSGLRAAIASLRTYEHAQAEAVIAGAHSLDDGNAGLAALRAKTTTAWRALDAALAALDVANTVNDDPSIKGAQAALNDAIAAIAALTGGTP